MKITSRVFVLVVTILFASVAAAHAQTTGSIAGVITSDTGGPVAGAIVSVGGIPEPTTSTATLSDGTYRIDGLPVFSDYVVRAGAPGYVFEYFDGLSCWLGCTLDTAKRVAVTAGATTTVNIALEPLATIKGRVTNAVTGAPLGGASFRVTLRTAAGRFVQNVAPEVDGRYQFMVPADSYVVHVEVAPLFVPQAWPGIPCKAADCQPTTGTLLVPGRGETRTADFALVPEGRIVGTVRRSSDGSPMENLSIAAYNGAGSFAGSGITGVDGRNTVSGLSAGSYFVRVVEEHGAHFPVVAELYRDIPCIPDIGAARPCRLFDGAPVAVIAGQDTTGIDFALDQTATIGGRVTSSDGTPLENISVSIDGPVHLGITQTDRLGNYRASVYVPGTYTIRTRTAIGGSVLGAPTDFADYVDEWYGGGCVLCGDRPTPVVVGASDVLGLDITLTRGGAISGTVTLNPPPISGFGRCVNLQLYSSTGARLDIAGPDGVCRGPGPFSLRGLPTGTYYLFTRDRAAAFFNPGVPWTGDFVDEIYPDIPCITADCDPRRGAPIRVTAGAVTGGINVRLDRGGSIVGTIPTANTGVVDETDERGAELYDGRGVLVLRKVRYSPFSSAGYEAVGLPPGTYYLRAIRSRPFGVPRQIFQNVFCPDCPPTAGTPVVLGSAADVQRANLSLEPGGFAISGTITDSSGPLSSITVALYDEAGVQIATDTTDVVGRYSITAIASGTYFARTMNTRGYVDQVFGSNGCADCGIRRGTPIVVSSSDLTGVDFLLERGGSLLGTVMHDGFPAADVGVRIVDGTGALVTLTQTTSPQGTFEAAVPAGTYYARTEPTSGRSVELYRDLPCPSGTCDPTLGAPLTVAAGGVVRGIDFTPAACSGITVTPRALASGAEGRAYRQRFIASGGVAPYVFTVTIGALPAGLTLNADTGVLDGTPTTSGRHAFSVAAVDASGCAGRLELSIDVARCAFAVTPAFVTLGSGGGSATITAYETCGSRTVTTQASWLHAGSLPSGSPAQLTVSVDPNPSRSTRTGTVLVGRRVFTVYQAGVASVGPFGAVDIPADGSQVSGSIAMGGWALDDVRVTRVRILRDPVAGEGDTLVFLGDAVIVPGARPDVSRAFSTTPLNDRAGWGFLILTNMLPNQGNGRFRLHAYADDGEGHSSWLGTRSIVAANASATKPFGAIDTPAQGETIGGSAYLNFGWALTPQPKSIAADGSTIRVFIDGVSIGSPSYGFFRSDVSTLFPGLANSAGPVGFRALDTTTLADGIHTIEWGVTDSAGAGTGIGSRYFTVSNSTDGVPPPSVTSAAVASPFNASLGTPPGEDTGRSTSAILTLPRVATRVIEARPLQRIRLDLRDASGADACAPAFAGYLRVDGALRELPAGSALNPAGTFTWLAGPAFIGTYNLEFVRTGCDGKRDRIEVTVTLAPK